MKDINLNKISGQISKNISGNSAYNNTKAVYDMYVKKIEKTDFANSVTRYEVELNMLKSMKELAVKNDNLKELSYIEERITNAKNKLSEFGIKIKE